MLNVYDISIDQGTNGLLSNLNGKVIFNAAGTNGKIILSTSNIKEAYPSLYYSDIRVNSNENVQKGLQSFLWGNHATHGYVIPSIDNTTAGMEYTLTKKNNNVYWEAVVDANGISFSNKTILSNISNWDGTNYIGGIITGTFGGQQYTDNKFWYLAITDNNFIRIPRYEFTTANINNGDISYSKIQNVTANRILGRVTSTGAIQELALSSGLAFSGASLTASATVTPAGSSGSIQFNNAGALGADSNIFWNNTAKTFLLGGGGFFSNTILHMNGNANNFYQSNIKNSNAGVSASSDYVATADTGDQSSNYIDMGINSSVYSDAAFTISTALDGYLYTNGGNLVLGTQSSNKGITFHTGGTLAANKRGTIDSTGKWGMGNITPNTIVDVNGDVAMRKGIDYSSSGTFNNVPTTATSNIRFTNNTAPTITGFGQGFDGKILYVSNTGTGTLTIANNSGSSLTANRILTGSGADRLLPSGGTIQLLYDSTATVWRLQTGGSRMLNGSIAIAEASWSANTNYTIDITVTGAAVNDRVAVTVTPTIVDSVNTASEGLVLNGYVLSANTVRVWARVTQFTTTTGGTWYVTVLK